jgi:hypothetical protein
MIIHRFLTWGLCRYADAVSVLGSYIRTQGRIIQAIISMNPAKAVEAFSDFAAVNKALKGMGIDTETPIPEEEGPQASDKLFF